MTTQLNLDQHAAAILQHYQAQHGPVSAQVEQAIIVACETSPSPQLSATALAQALLQAMPSQKCAIEQAQSKCLGYQCDGSNGSFMTQILAIRIEKEIDQVRRPSHSPAGPFARDPYYTTLTLDPDGDFFLLFNARDVDRNGRPLLMKVIARERADVAKLDLSEYRRREGNAPDVERISNTVDFLEVKDTQENEFEFGDPLKQLTLGEDACEMSTTVKVLPRNILIVNNYMPRRDDPTQPDLARRVGAAGREVGQDRTPVVTFPDRVRVRADFQDSFITNGGWMNTRPGDDMQLSLEVERGLMFEPGTTAQIQTKSEREEMAVAADDAQLLGSPSLSSPYRVSLLEVLRDAPVLTVNTGNARGVPTTVRFPKGEELLNAYPTELRDNVSVAGSQFIPWGESGFSDFEEMKLSASKVPTPGDPERDSQRVTIKLDPGFVAAGNGASIKGWKIVAGYTDERNRWVGTKPIQIDDPDSFCGGSLTVDVDKAPMHLGNGKELEIRVFNQDNLPAQKVRVPLRKIEWAERCGNRR